MTERRKLIGACMVIWLAVLVAGCNTNSPARSDDINDSVFTYDRSDMEGAIDDCKQAPSKDCRNNMARIVKAHVDAAKLAQPVDRDLREKAFSLLTLGGTVGATRSSDTGKDDIATGLALVTGIRSILEIGDDDDGGLHSSDIWEKITLRMNLSLSEYPLEAALADLDEYREVMSAE